MKFTMKLIAKTVLFAAVTMVVFIVLQSAVFNNQIAMGQLENSNEAYAAMQFINNIRPLVRGGYRVFCVAMLASVGFDIYKYTHIEEEANTEEGEKTEEEREIQ